MNVLEQCGRVEVHADPRGSAYGDGTLDYPVDSVAAALRIVRSTRRGGQPAVVWLHAGTFLLTQTLVLDAGDSRTTFAAWPVDDTPVDTPSDTPAPAPTVALDGGHRLTGWELDSLGGRTIWSAPAPEGAGRSLFVDGRRVPRPRLPRTGTLRIAGQDGLDLTAGLNATLFEGADHFTVADGDLPELLDPTGVEVVVPHFWIQERMPVASVDATTGTVHSPYRSILSLRDGDSDQFARYYLDGVVDVLGEEPGEWYLDRSGTVQTSRYPGGSGAARVLYAPRDGEDIATFEAVLPVVGQLVVIDGSQDQDRPACDIRFEGVAFRYADWSHAPSARPPFQSREDPLLSPDVLYASDPQAASTVPGAVDLSFAHRCALVDCIVEHVGGYAVRLGPGCQANLVSGCTLEDLGAGGVSCGGGPDRSSTLLNTGNEVSDCVVRHGGRVYPHAVAILLRHASRSVVAHNLVHDFYSTAIACGWRWDYGDSPSVDNLIEGNHLHTLGQGVLDWFGAIYTLGVSPGTVIRGNLVHDVQAAAFGGWGLLIDPATAHVVVEGNIVHTVSSECLHIKTGRENIVRDNLFAYGELGQVSLAVPEAHVSATLTNNVLVGRGAPAFVGAPGSAPVEQLSLRSDLNLIWDETGPAILAANLREPAPPGAPGGVDAADDAWRALGRDTHSVISDPGLHLEADGRLTLTDGDAARQVGFRPWSHRPPGPRPVVDRRNPGRTRIHPYTPFESGAQR